MAIAWRAVFLMSMVLLLSNCTSFNGRCNYIPSNPCGCDRGVCNFFWSKHCARYIKEEVTYKVKRCGACACSNDTCSNCWNCGKQFVDQ